jgi:excisionase family DNA binding protein
MNDNHKLAYSIPEAADALGGVSESTVWRMIRDGDLTTSRVRGRTVIRREVLVAYLDAQDAALAHAA